MRGRASRSARRLCSWRGRSTSSARPAAIHKLLQANQDASGPAGIANNRSDAELRTGQHGQDWPEEGRRIDLLSSCCASLFCCGHDSAEDHANAGTRKDQSAGPASATTRYCRHRGIIRMRPGRAWRAPTSTAAHSAGRRRPSEPGWVAEPSSERRWQGEDFTLAPSQRSALAKVEPEAMLRRGTAREDQNSGRDPARGMGRSIWVYATIVG